MDNNMHKEKWIGEVLGSTNGMVGAQPRSGLYDRIVTRLGEPEPTKNIRIPVGQWAAAAILLIAVNMGSVIYYTSTRPIVANASTISVAAEIQSISTYNY